MLSATVCSTLFAQSIAENLSTSTAVIVRDPARQSSTEVDAAIYNPAGTAFLKDGLCFSVSGIANLGSTKANESTQSYKINENYVMPSVQVAFKTGKWAFSGSFASEGGYRRNYKNGSVVVDGQVGLYNEWLASSKYSDRLQTIAELAEYVYDLPDIGIDIKDEFRFSQYTTKTHLYNYAFRLGAAYEISERFSAYAGLKLNRVSWKVKPNLGMEVYNPSSEKSIPFSEYSNNVSSSSFEELNENIPEGMKQDFVDCLNTYNDPNNILIDVFSTPFAHTESGWGFAPVVGVDYKSKDFNIGMKYEFGSHINISDGDDFTLPAILSLGGNWQSTQWLNLAVGGDIYFKSAGNPIIACDNNLYWDVSLSATFTCSKSLKANIGWQIGRQNYWMEDFAYRTPTPYKAVFPNKFSVGLRYAFSDKISADLGVAIAVNQTIYSHLSNSHVFDVEDKTGTFPKYSGNSSTDVTYKVRTPIQIALGFNYGI